MNKKTYFLQELSKDGYNIYWIIPNGELFTRVTRNESPMTLYNVEEYIRFYTSEFTPFRLEFTYE